MQQKFPQQQWQQVPPRQPQPQQPAQPPQWQQQPYQPAPAPAPQPAPQRYVPPRKFPPPVNSDYATFARNFVAYKWYKPLLTGLLTFVLMMVFGVLIVLIAIAWGNAAGEPIDLLNYGYDDMSVYTGPAALMNLGSVAAMLPALAIAVRIVYDRPFSSYSSSRGGWNWSAFGKSFLLALFIVALPGAIQEIFFPTTAITLEIQFNIVGFVVCTILLPFQCIAEEYVFRGLIMQAFGSWTRIPVLAIICQAVAFAAGHPYDIVGVIAIFISGCCMGVVAWQTKGLEASSAMHLANNMAAFYLAGFGFEAISSEVSIYSLLLGAAVEIVFTVVVILLGKKRNWFAPKPERVTEFNYMKLNNLALQGKLPQEYL